MILDVRGFRFGVRDFRVRGSGFLGLGASMFGVWVLRFRVRGFGFRGFEVSGSGFNGSGFRVRGFEFGFSGS